MAHIPSQDFSSAKESSCSSSSVKMGIFLSILNKILASHDVSSLKEERRLELLLMCTLGIPTTISDYK